MKTITEIFVLLMCIIVHLVCINYKRLCHFYNAAMVLWILPDFPNFILTARLWCNWKLKTTECVQSLQIQIFCKQSHYNDNNYKNDIKWEMHAICSETSSKIVHPLIFWVAVFVHMKECRTLRIWFQSSSWLVNCHLPI